MYFSFLYCIHTLNRHSWIPYTCIWLSFIVYKHWADTPEFHIDVFGFPLLYTNIEQTLLNSIYMYLPFLYCIQTLSRHSWIPYTCIWLSFNVYKHWADTPEFHIHVFGFPLLYTNIEQTLLNSIYMYLAFLYCIQTLSRHSWITYTCIWLSFIVYKH